MSDTLLALGITVMLLAALAAWVPLLHVTERLTRRSARVVEPDLPQSRERAQVPDSPTLEQEIAG